MKKANLLCYIKCRQLFQYNDSFAVIFCFIIVLLHAQWIFVTPIIMMFLHSKTQVIFWNYLYDFGLAIVVVIAALITRWYYVGLADRSFIFIERPFNRNIIELPYASIDSFKQYGKSLLLIFHINSRKKPLYIMTFYEGKKLKEVLNAIDNALVKDNNENI